MTGSINGNLVEYPNKTTKMGSSSSALAELEHAALEQMTNLGADGYAVCRTKRFAREDQDRVTVVFSSTDDSMRDVLTNLGPQVLSHMEKSLLPFSWSATDDHSSPSTGFVQQLPLQSSGPGGVGFPVRLGIMGNGFLVFFGPHLDLSGDRIVEIHREAFRLLRGLLKLDVNKTVTRESLNDRELQCLQLAADGYKSEAIAAELQLSVHTVNAYLGFAAGKLDAVNRIQAIAKAVRLGLIG